MEEEAAGRGGARVARRRPVSREAAAEGGACSALDRPEGSFSPSLITFRFLRPLIVDYSIWEYFFF